MKLIIAGILLTSGILLTTFEFQKAIGTSGVDRGKIILKSTDGFIVVGEKSSTDFTRKEVFVYQTDKQGNVQWGKSYGGNESYVVNDAFLDSNQHIHLSSERYLNNRESLIYLHLNETGDLQNASPYDEGGNEVEPWAIAPAENGNKLVVGFTKIADFVPGGFYNASLETKHLYILKEDANGTKIWSKKLMLPNNTSSFAYDITKTSDGNYCIIGQAIMDNAIYNLLFKINTNGSIIWSKKINEGNVIFRNITTSYANNELLITGYAEDDAGSTDMFISKINDTNGSIVWSKRYGKLDKEYGKGVIANENHIIFTGTTKSFGSQQDQIMVGKVNHQGDLLWTNKYGSNVLEDVSAPILDNNNIVFTGFSLRTPNGAESLLFNVGQNSKTDHEKTIDEHNFPLTTTSINLDFEDMTTPSFGGSYTLSNTIVTPLQLNSTNLNF